MNAERLIRLYLVVRLHVLHLAARFNMLLAASSARSLEGKEQKQDELFGDLRYTAYCYSAAAEGWQEFCRQTGTDLRHMDEDMPGGDVLDYMNKAARKAAFTQEEADAWARRGGGEAAKAPTAADHVEAMRRCVGASEKSRQ
jgi:hypothetical protein